MDNYLEIIPKELLEIVISKLDAKELEIINNILLITPVNWRNVYNLRYPFFNKLYSKIKHKLSNPYNYNIYFSIIKLENMSELKLLYDNIIYGYSNYKDIILTKDLEIFGYISIDDEIELKEPQIRLLAELYIANVYSEFYEIFNKYNVIIPKYINMINSLHNIITFDHRYFVQLDVHVNSKLYSYIKDYIILGKWCSDYKITLQECMDLLQKYFYVNPIMSDVGVIWLIIVHILLEDNVQVEWNDIQYMLDIGFLNIIPDYIKGLFKLLKDKYIS